LKRSIEEPGSHAPNKKAPQAAGPFNYPGDYFFFFAAFFFAGAFFLVAIINSPPILVSLYELLLTSSG
jgi:hypothetical protein